MSGKIRIIGGQWRGRKLAVGDAPGLRPTGDRARETLFNWLQPVLGGARCLDLFAGTGALGLEALSRGAAEAVFVEQDRRLVAALRQLTAEWPGGERAEVIEVDALCWLRETDRRFDLVFVDPPFELALQQHVLELLAAGDVLVPGGRIYLEQAAHDPEPELTSHFRMVRTKRLGDVRMTLLERVV